MRSRSRWSIALAGACLLVVSGCAATVTGSGTGSGAPPANSAPPTQAPTSTPPTTAPPTTAPPTTAPPTTAPPTSGSPPSGRCSGAFCDDFSSRSSGWDVVDEPHFFTAYSGRLGGTFRMGERHDAVLTVPAPYDITKAAADDSVQVDADVILAANATRHAIYGMSCWNHDAHNGETSAFLFYVTQGGAQIVLWDNVDGTAHVLRNKAWSNVLQPWPHRNKMRVRCLQGADRHGPVAELGMSVNGEVLTALYDKSAKHHAWRTGNRVGLIVGLDKSDVFYDNFAITGECKGSSC